MVEEFPSEEPAFPPTLTTRPGALRFIFVTALLDVMALGIIIPVLPELVKNFLGGNTASAARVFGLFGTVWAAMQFVAAPVLGMVSDRFGRRPVLLISCFGLGLDYILMALAPTLGWLFVGRVISGITSASFATAGAYIADISPPEKRAANFGMMGAAFGVGFVLGPAIGGLLGGMNPRLPFWFSAGFALLNALYGYFVLPESLPRARRSPRFQWGRANPVGSLRLLRSHRELFGLASVNFTMFVTHQSLPSVYVLYVMYRYHWTEGSVGLTLAAAGISNIAVQGFLIKPLVARLGEPRACVLGLVCGAVGFAIYGSAPSGALFWIGIPIFALVGLFGSAVQSIMTSLVQPGEQGQLQGANSSLMGIAGMIGPTFFTRIFAASIDPARVARLPGAPFLAAAAILLFGTGLAWQVTKRLPRRVGSTS